ncbi:acyltransferase domain-containing protein [Anthocerotibacter panamensis]|uniref:acyltransferase domain-containing protein n=1 Tax=Anthocerotibacter panamensis TaxID=2857077 RepID=UPI001C405F5F|nr:ACP S-malonyltransferase [Anthocerotibacter panamensis]
MTAVTQELTSAPSAALSQLVVGYLPTERNALAAQRRNLAQALSAGSPRPVQSIDLRMAGSPYRAFAILSSAEPWLEVLDRTLQEASDFQSDAQRGLWWGSEVDGEVVASPLAWVMPGSGSLKATFYEDLAALDPVVVRVREEAELAFWQHTGEQVSFLDLADEEDPRSTHPRYQRPATVTASVAMARLLGRYGIQPQLLAGHSVGELTACHLAGCFDLSELIRLTTAPFLGETLAVGAMCALIGDEAVILQVIQEAGGSVMVSNRNSLRQLVISGPAAEIQAIIPKAKAAGLKAIALKVATAYHSPFLEEPHRRYREALASTRFQKARMPVVSGLTTDILPWSEVNFSQTRALLDCAFIGPVNHVGQVRRLQELGMGALVDLGPTEKLSKLARDILDIQTITALGANPTKGSGRQGFLECLAQLHTLGYSITVPE